MLYVAIAVGICLLVPNVLMWLCGLSSYNLPNPIIPGELTKTTTGERPTTKPISDVQAAATGQAAATVVYEVTDHPPKPRSFTRSYHWYKILIGPLLIALMVGGMVGWFFVLAWLYQRRMAELPPSVHLVEPGWAIMVMPAIFLGLFTAIFPMDLLNRLFLGRRYHDFEEWEQGRLGLQTRADARTFLFRLGLLFSVPSALFTSLGMDWYGRFGEEEIAIHRFWTLGERTYTYSRVRHIVVTTHFRNLFGAVVAVKRYSIVFDDGSVWCNQDIAAKKPPQRDREVLQFVSRKSGKPVVQARLIEDVVE